MHNKPFQSIGIIGKPSDPSIADTLNALYDFLTQQDFNIIIDEQSSAFIKYSNIATQTIEKLAQDCDVVIAIGGDGTFLAAARAIAAYQIPLIGVNLGRLGFLVDISPEHLNDKLGPMLQGDYCEEQRSLLSAKILRDNHVIHEQTAFNEVVVHRWITPSMIEIITSINGRYMNTQRSDGLIISTPTGSTAYSLSAGGPIIHPSIKALVLVPLNPHTLSNRPVVIDEDSEIEISFSQSKQINALVTCDHLEIPDVLISDKILIQKQANPITILHPEGHDFFNTLREKLNWSRGNHI